MSKYTDFYNKWYGKYIDLDGMYGCQCWDGAINYLKSLYGVVINCTYHGYACDIWEQRQYNNILKYCNEYPKEKAKQGDIIVFDKSDITPYSHIGIVDSVSNGYVSTFGTNQGGKDGVYNIVNIPLSASFPTVFRPKCLDDVEPQKPILKWIKEGVSFYASKDGVDVHRLFNKYSQEHFYTTSEKERDSLVALGWTYEGVAWKSPKEGDEIYRCYNPNNGFHIYTLSPNEVNVLVKIGWKLESVGFRSDEKKAIPVYRAYLSGNGDHFFTIDKKEYEGL